MSEHKITKSSRVRAIDFEQPWFEARAKEMCEPLKIHRKLWEFAVIAQVFREKLPYDTTSGMKALGFGVGQEPLSSWFVSQGAAVLGTDLVDGAACWIETDQNASRINDLYKEGVCTKDAFDSLMSFQPVDMRRIPGNLLRGRYDFTWSAGSFEHIGSINNSINFFCRQMKCLRPGGIAAHTTEFNYLSDVYTYQSPNLVLLRECDLRVLEKRLDSQGDKLWELDLIQGEQLADLYVDRPPYFKTDYHLNITISNTHHTSTSILLVAEKGSGRSQVSVTRNKKTILWAGDSPTVPSGFAHCTDSVCEQLHENGWDVHVLGTNYFGDPHNKPYSIYPCFYPSTGNGRRGGDYGGVTKLPTVSNKIKPDIVVIQTDPWNVPYYLDSLYGESDILPITVGWLAVDGKCQMGEPINAFHHVSVWTEFAAKELRRGGYTGDLTIIPLGVDAELFKPVDKVEARKLLCPDTVPETSFIVGVVGGNQQRKRLDLSIQYFSEWVKNYNIDDAYLYIHTGPTSDRAFDVQKLTRYYGLLGRVIISETDTGKGIEKYLLPALYSSFDVYLTTTQGEGWGLTALEAMACGVPCVVPDYSGLGSWVGDTAIKIECTAFATSAPLNRRAYTIGGIPDKALTVEALNKLYRDKKHRGLYSERGINLAATLPKKRTGEIFLEMLNGILDGG